VTTTTTLAATTSEMDPAARRRTARATGLLYLGLGVTGMLGYLLVRNQIFVADDPAGTLANLTERAGLARVGIALEMGTVLTQALAAVWFFRLFRTVDSFAAGSLAAFGVVNAVMISASAALLAGALDVAGDSALAPGADAAATAQLLTVLSEHFWGVGAIFFGLWLIPMGSLVVRSGWLPRSLGQLLMAGGVGYILSAFVAYLFTDADTIADLMTLPATVGEFWIIGYLIIRGTRDRD
jgi:Domain of unknown function (DUF4386)